MFFFLETSFASFPLFPVLCSGNNLHKGQPPFAMYFFTIYCCYGGGGANVWELIHFILFVNNNVHCQVSGFFFLNFGFQLHMSIEATVVGWRLKIHRSLLNRSFMSEFTKGCLLKLCGKFEILKILRIIYAADVNLHRTVLSVICTTSYKVTLHRHVLVTISTKFNKNPFNVSLLTRGLIFRSL